ncbi:MAG: UTP--glucose-1-phosphate uridylyltransferase GalU [Gallionellaceae bacterium]|nr:UTP--glucose-1-phosphate uridylyltransferase GalU [Gallionellaceae bacterium]
MQRVTKAVFPVAGMGTRFLPATKANPKEMLPIVDKPLIQYAVEEAVAAGITDLIFINGRNKRAIPDHFDKAYELEAELESKGKKQLLEIVRGILPDYVNCIYIRQSQALGLGHAVLCAEPAVNNEPFVVLLADDLIDAEPGVTQQMVEQFSYYNCSLVGVQDVAREETNQYGIVVSQPMSDRLSRISAMVEKPKPEEAPSTLGVVGRYVFIPRIFDHLRNLGRGSGGEIQLTDGIVSLLKEQQVLAYQYHGKRYDCGSKLGYLQATVEYALKHPELAEDFAAYLAELNRERGSL